MPVINAISGRSIPIHRAAADRDATQMGH